MIFEFAVAALLLFCSIIDIYKKKIYLWMLGLFLPCFVLSIIEIQGIGIESRIAGAGIGGIFLILSKLTRQQIGNGDGLLICVLGLVSGFWEILKVLSFCFFVLGIFSMVLLGFRLVTRKKRIPFIPFLFIGYCGCIWLGS